MSNSKNRAAVVIIRIISFFYLKLSKCFVCKNETEWFCCEQTTVLLKKKEDVFLVKLLCLSLNLFL